MNFYQWIKNGTTQIQTIANPSKLSLFINLNYKHIRNSGNCIVLLSLLTFSISLKGQSLWQVVTPFPEKVINRLEAPDSLLLKAIGYYDFVYSNDGGHSWNSIPFNSFLIDISFTDELNGWISSDSGRIYHTIDGGLNWTTVQLPSTASVNQIQFITSNDGFALTGQNRDSLFITHTNGMSWNLSQLNIPLFPSVNIIFSSVLTGWIYGNDTVVYKSTDGGLNWNPQVLPNRIYPYETTIYFLDSLNGWISGEDSLMHTNDGGQTWNCISPFRTNGLTFIDSLQGISSSYLSFTNDGGITWTYTGRHSDNAISYMNTFFVCNTGNVFKSNDAVNWTTLAWNTFPYDFQSSIVSEPLLKFSSAADGVFVTTGNNGTSGHFDNNTFVTRDSGKTWVDAGVWQCNTDMELFTDSLWYFTRIISYNNPSYFCKSYDQLQNSVDEYAFSGIVVTMDFSDSLHGCVGGSFVSCTNDGGITWNSSNYPASILNWVLDINFIDSLHGWFITSDEIVKTNDGGANWITIYTAAYYTNLRKIYFTDSLIGYAIIDSTSAEDWVIKTVDGGYTWNLMNTPSGLHDIYFKDNLHGWLLSESGIYYTADGLSTYTLQENHPTQLISFYDSVHAHACGNGFLHRSDQTSIINYAATYPVYFGIRIFPNPTTGHLTISLPEGSLDTDVTITNTFGQEVSKASYSNASKLELEIKGASGLYFVRIMTGQKYGVYKVVKL